MSFVIQALYWLTALFFSPLRGKGLAGGVAEEMMKRRRHSKPEHKAARYTTSLIATGFHALLCREYWKVGVEA